MTTTIEFITALFCQVDEQKGAIPKHPEALLWPSEVVTLGLLHALKGVGNRPFYRWLTREVVYLSAADNSIGRRIRYNPPVSPPSEGVLP